MDLRRRCYAGSVISEAFSSRCCKEPSCKLVSGSCRCRKLSVIIVERDLFCGCAHAAAIGIERNGIRVWGPMCINIYASAVLIRRGSNSCIIVYSCTAVLVLCCWSRAVNIPSGKRISCPCGSRKVLCEIAIVRIFWRVVDLLSIWLSIADIIILVFGRGKGVCNCWGVAVNSLSGTSSDVCGCGLNRLEHKFKFFPDPSCIQVDWKLSVWNAARTYRRNIDIVSVWNVVRGIVAVPALEIIVVQCRSRKCGIGSCVSVPYAFECKSITDNSGGDFPRRIWCYDRTVFCKGGCIECRKIWL